MKAFITKFALTQGIFTVEAEEPASDCPELLTVPSKAGLMTQYYGKGEWYRTFPAARQRAYDMQRAKLSSLRKSIEKIEALRFESEP